MTSNVLRLVTYDSAGGVALECLNPSTIAVDTWTHAVVTYDGGLCKLYVNNILQTETINQVITAHYGSLKIGKYSQTDPNVFSGDIDQFRVFDRVLDGTEVYQLYAEGARGTGL